MSLRPLGRGITAGERADSPAGYAFIGGGTPTVPGGHGQSLVLAEQPLPGPGGDDPAEVVEHDGHDPGFPVEPHQYLLRGQDDAVAGGRGAATGLERVLVHEEGDGGGHPARLWQQFRPGQQLEPVQDRVVAALPRRTGILLPVGFGLGPGHRVEEGAEPPPQAGGPPWSTPG
jgi:hypothetical protein